MVKREEELEVPDLVCVIEHVLDGVVRPPFELISEVLDSESELGYYRCTIVQRKSVKTQLLRIPNILLDVCLRNAANHVVRNT